MSSLPSESNVNTISREKSILTPRLVLTGPTRPHRTRSHNKNQIVASAGISKSEESEANSAIPNMECQCLIYWDINNSYLPTNYPIKQALTRIYDFVRSFHHINSSICTKVFTYENTHGARKGNCPCLLGKDCLNEYCMKRDMHFQCSLASSLKTVILISDDSSLSASLRSLKSKNVNALRIYSPGKLQAFQVSYICAYIDMRTLLCCQNGTTALNTYATTSLCGLINLRSEKLYRILYLLNCIYVAELINFSDLKIAYASAFPHDIYIASDLLNQLKSQKLISEDETPHRGDVKNRTLHKFTLTSKGTSLMSQAANNMHKALAILSRSSHFDTQSESQANESVSNALTRLQSQMYQKIDWCAHQLRDRNFNENDRIIVKSREMDEDLSSQHFEEVFASFNTDVMLKQESLPREGLGSKEVDTTLKAYERSPATIAEVANKEFQYLHAHMIAMNSLKIDDGTGYCYQVLFSEEYRDEAKIALGPNPTLHNLLTFKYRPLKIVKGYELVINSLGHLHVREQAEGIIRLKQWQHKFNCSQIRIGMWNGRYKRETEKLQVQEHLEMDNLSSQQGYCYLHLFHDNLQMVAAKQLGSWPTASTLRRFSRANKVSLDKVINCRVERTTANTSHIIKDARSALTLRSLFNAQNGSHRYGGLMGFAKVKIQHIWWPQGLAKWCRRMALIVWAFAVVLSIGLYLWHDFQQLLPAHTSRYLICAAVTTTLIAISSIWLSYSVLQPQVTLLDNNLTKDFSHNPLQRREITEYAHIMSECLDGIQAPDMTLIHLQPPVLPTADQLSVPELEVHLFDGLLGPQCRPEVAASYIKLNPIFYSRISDYFDLKNDTPAFESAVKIKPLNKQRNVVIPSFNSVVTDQAFKRIYNQYALSVEPITSANAYYFAMMSLSTHILVNELSVNKTALVYNSNPLEWHPDGFHHCIFLQERHQVPMELDLNELKAKIDQGIYYHIIEKELSKIPYVFDYLIFPLTQYVFDIKRIIFEAFKRKQATIYLIEFNCLDLLDREVGVLTSLNLKWRKYLEGTEKIIQFSSMIDGSFNFTLKEDLIVQHLLTTAVNCESHSYKKVTINHFGDLVVTKYIFTNSNDTSQSLQLRNYHAQHYQMLCVADINETLSFRRGNIFNVRLIPTPILVQLKSTAASMGERVIVSTLVGTAYTLCSSYENNLEDPISIRYIRASENFDSIMTSIVEVAKAEAVLNMENDPHGGRFIRANSITSILSYIMSDDYRLRLWSKHHSSAINPRFRESQEFEAVTHNTAALFKTNEDSSSIHESDSSDIISNNVIIDLMKQLIDTSKIVLKSTLISIHDNFKRYVEIATIKLGINRQTINNDSPSLQQSLINSNIMEECEENISSYSSQEQEIPNVDEFHLGNMMHVMNNRRGFNESDAESAATTNEMNSINEHNMKNHTAHHLGSRTNIRNFDIQYDIQEFTNRKTDNGTLHSSYMNDMITAIFTCPERIYELIVNQSAGSESFLLKCALGQKLSQAYIIKGERYVGPSVTPENIRKCPIVIWEGNEFIRFRPTDLNLCVTTFHNKEKIEGDILDLAIADHLNVESCDTVHCLYKAIPGCLIPQNVEMCTPNGIREAINTSNYAILYNRTIYRSDHVRGLVYVQNSHAYKCTVPNIETFCNLFPNVSYMNWHKSLNGPINDETLLELETMNTLEEQMQSEKNKSQRLDSVIEIIEYNILLQRTLVARFQMIDDTNKLSYLRALTNVHVYSTLTNQYLNGTPVNQHKYCWSQGKFQELLYDKQQKIFRCEDSGNYIYISDEISFLRERQLVRILNARWDELKHHDFESIAITLINGVPGCGKTYKIKSEHRPGVDLVCTSTRAGCQEYRKNYKVNKEYYRTYDSVLLNGAPQCNKMYADEGLMEHAGMILITAFIVKAKIVEISGDLKQIPFISRAIGFAPKCHILNLNEIVNQLNTYRLPRNMEAILTPFYPGIKCLSEDPGEPIIIVKTPTPQLIPSGFDIYLCFTQEEKSALKHLKSAEIKTIHEAQGGTWGSVCLYRTRPQENPIYASLPHIIVGISRHTHRLEYHTALMEDKTCKILKGMSSGPESYKETLNKSLCAVKIKMNCAPSMFLTRVTLSGNIDDKDKDALKWIMSYARADGETTIMYTKYMFRVDNPMNTRDWQTYDTALVQSMYDTLFTPMSDMDYLALEEQDVFPLEEEFKLDLAKLGKPKGREREFLSPILRTTQPYRDSGHIVGAINGIRKRNLDPPVIHFTRPPDIIKDIVDAFMTTYINETILHQFRQRNSPRNGQWWINWFKTRTPERQKALRAFAKYPRRETTFATHIRPDHKPKMDNTHTAGVAGQTVTAHHPLVTAKYSGTAKYLMAAIKTSMHRKWAINDELTAEELNGHINYVLHGVSECTPQEIDFSKFDKSQEELCLNVQISIMKALGVPDDICAEWHESHTINKLVFHQLGISITTKYQRRSGDVLTFLGNTIVLMAVLAYTHDYTTAHGGIFGGDDSLVFLRRDTNVIDQSKHIAEIFNLTAKMEFFPEAPYFASKFLIYAAPYYYMVPDPVKAITRLGRHDLYCDEHVHYSWLSFCDNYRLYTNRDVRNEVAKAALMRYSRIFNSTPTSLNLFSEFIAELIVNEKKFKSLYYGNEKLRKRKLTKALKTEITRKQSRQLMYEMDEIENIFQTYN